MLTPNQSSSSMHPRNQPETPTRKLKRRGTGPMLANGLAVASLLGTAAQGLAAEQPRAPEKPNVIMFLVDDLGWGHNSLGYSRANARQRGDADPFFETPHLETLAGKGMTFTQAYCPAAMCSPTRAAILTGHSPARLGLTSHIPGNRNPGYEVADWTRNLPAESTTLAELFQKSGYTTAHVGKWHLGMKGNPAGDPRNHGFDINIGGNNSGSPATNGGSYWADENGAFPWAPNLPGGNGNKPGEYPTYRLTREAIKIIRHVRDQGEPFFLDLWHYGVHTPLQAPDDLVKKYVKKIGQNSYKLFKNIDPKQKKDIATYAAMVETIDDSLGQVLKTLEELGIDDNTIVIFASDNGAIAARINWAQFTTKFNHPLRSGKTLPYEGGLRTPLVVRWHGHTRAGAVSDEPVGEIDFYPTLQAALGLPRGNDILDGEDITPLLEGKDPKGRQKPFVWHYPHTVNKGKSATGESPDPYSAIRHGDWKLVQRYHPPDGSISIELYNLEEDPREKENLADANPTKAAEMQTMLKDYLIDVNAGLPPGVDL